MWGRRGAGPCHQCRGRAVPIPYHPALWPTYYKAKDQQHNEDFILAQGKLTIDSFPLQLVNFNNIADLAYKRN